MCVLSTKSLSVSQCALTNTVKAMLDSPYPTIENQIVHMSINKKFRRSTEDVRTKRGFDKPSYNHLLMAQLEQELKNL